MSKKRLLFIFGTRPEVIKVAPVISYFLNNYRNIFEIITCSTGQHKDMVEQMLKSFNIKLDCNLEIMEENQTLSGLSSKTIASVDKILLLYKPDAIFVHGDTTAAFCSALVAFYHKIDIFHIEAGLRTHNIYLPFPEELNRRYIDIISNLCFTPTRQASKNAVVS